MKQEVKKFLLFSQTKKKIQFRWKMILNIIDMILVKHIPKIRNFDGKRCLKDILIIFMKEVNLNEIIF